jgi:hypothetical protein
MVNYNKYINSKSSKYQSSGPIVVQNDDDESRNAIFNSNKNYTKKRTRKTCCVIGLGIHAHILL